MISAGIFPLAIQYSPTSHQSYSPCSWHDEATLHEMEEKIFWRAPLYFFTPESQVTLFPSRKVGCYHVKRLSKKGTPGRCKKAEEIKSPSSPSCVSYFPYDFCSTNINIECLSHLDDILWGSYRLWKSGNICLKLASWKIEVHVAFCV